MYLNQTDFLSTHLITVTYSLHSMCLNDYIDDNHLGQSREFVWLVRVLICAAAYGVHSWQFDSRLLLPAAVVMYNSLPVRVYDSTSSYMDLELDKAPFCDNSGKRSICNEFNIN
jgi:hypothetical protein